MAAARGALHTPGRAKQLHDFSGLRWGTITPTDLDGLVDWHGKAWAFLEIKGEGHDLGVGQRRAFTEIIDDLERSGKWAALFVATHYVRDPGCQVDASRCLVQRVYMMREWKPIPEPATLRWAMDHYFAWVDKQLTSAPATLAPPRELPPADYRVPRLTPQQCRLF